MARDRIETKSWEIRASDGVTFKQAEFQARSAFGKYMERSGARLVGGPAVTTHPMNAPRDSAAAWVFAWRVRP